MLNDAYLNVRIRINESLLSILQSTVNFMSSVHYRITFIRLGIGYRITVCTVLGSKVYTEKMYIHPVT